MKCTSIDKKWKTLKINKDLQNVDSSVFFLTFISWIEI